MPWKCLLMMSCAVKERRGVWIRFMGSPRQSEGSPRQSAATKAKRLRATKTAMAPKRIRCKTCTVYAWPIRSLTKSEQAAVSDGLIDENWTSVPKTECTETLIVCLNIASWMSALLGTPHGIPSFATRWFPGWAPNWKKMHRGGPKLGENVQTWTWIMLEPKRETTNWRFRFRHRSSHKISLSKSWY